MISKNYILGFVALCLGVVACTKSDIDETSSDTDVPPGGVVLTYDCEELELNFNDTCVAENTIGLLDSACLCIPFSLPFDCPELGGNIGDPCPDGEGIISSDCTCIDDEECDMGLTYTIGEDSLNWNFSFNNLPETADIVEWYVNGMIVPPTSQWTMDYTFTEVTVHTICIVAYDLPNTVVCSHCVELDLTPLSGWDCPGLNGNVGDPCQDGWGIITDDCECIENDSNGFDCPDLGNIGDSCWVSIDNTLIGGVIDEDCTCQP